MVMKRSHFCKDPNCSENPLKSCEGCDVEMKLSRDLGRKVASQGMMRMIQRLLMLATSVLRPALLGVTQVSQTAALPFRVSYITSPYILSNSVKRFCWLSPSSKDNLNLFRLCSLSGSEHQLPKI